MGVDGSLTFDIGIKQWTGLPGILLCKLGRAMEIFDARLSLAMCMRDPIPQALKHLLCSIRDSRSISGVEPSESEDPLPQELEVVKKWMSIDHTKKIRDEMWTRAEATVPALDNSVPLFKYTDMARGWYKQIHVHLSKQSGGTWEEDMKLAYFYIVNFLELCINRILKHNGVNAAGNRCDAIWCKTKVEVCLKSMEDLKHVWNMRLDDKMQSELMRELNRDDDGEQGGGSGTGGAMSFFGGGGEASAEPSAPSMPISALLLSDMALGEGDAMDVGRERDALAQLRDPNSSDNISVLSHVRDAFRFTSPAPEMRDPLRMVFGKEDPVFQWNRYDYGVSFLPFLPSLPAAVSISPAACETNRCFFLHLGLATGVHPYALQFAFRARAWEGLKGVATDDFTRDMVGTVLDPAEFVDANALAFLWPVEFSQTNTRVCIMSGARERPLLMVFTPTALVEVQAKDVIIRCDGQHFTLLGPQTAGVLASLMAVFKNAGLVVMETEVDSKSYGAAHGTFSIAEYLGRYLGA